MDLRISYEGSLIKNNIKKWLHPLIVNTEAAQKETTKMHAITRDSSLKCPLSTVLRTSRAQLYVQASFQSEFIPVKVLSGDTAL